MKNLIKLSVAFVLLAATVPTVHAQNAGGGGGWRIGIEGGYLKSDATVKGNFIENNSADDTAIGFGLFGQYRIANSDWGVHFGWGQPGGNPSDSGAFTLLPTTLARLNQNPRLALTGNGMITLGLSGELDSAIDLLAIKTWRHHPRKPFVMFGYSQIDVSGTLTLNGSGFGGQGADLLTGSHEASVTLSGWKLVGGVEGGDKYPWFVAAEYGIYGGKDLTFADTILGDLTEQIELNTLGVRFGIAYPF